MRCRPCPRRCRVPTWLWDSIQATALNRTLLNFISPICFLFAISGIAGWGIFVAIPFLYSDLPTWIGTVVVVIGYFLALEILINWLCMLFVDTRLHPTSPNVSNATNNSIIQGTQLGESSRQPPTCDTSDITTLRTNNINAYTTIDLPNNATNNEPWQPNDNRTFYKVGNHWHEADGANFISARDTIPGTIQPTSAKTFGQWRFCEKCNMNSPPRCHHCGLCNKCILKRDHHCYVVARCVGYRNFRHFSVFVFYASLATIFAIVHALPYAYYRVIPNVRALDLFYPIAILRGLFGFINFRDMILIVLGWMLLGYLVFSTITLRKVRDLVLTGRTTFETENHLDVMDSRGTEGRLKGVYGRHWLWNFIVPLHIFYEPIDDPFTWPHLRYNGRHIS